MREDRGSAPSSDRRDYAEGPYPRVRQNLYCRSARPSFGAGTKAIFPPRVPTLGHLRDRETTAYVSVPTALTLRTWRQPLYTVIDDVKMGRERTSSPTGRRATCRSWEPADVRLSDVMSSGRSFVLPPIGVYVVQARSCADTP